MKGASPETPRSGSERFSTSPEFWMNLQITYDLRNAEKALPARMGSGFRIALCVTF
jgi:plasmid maintenance system antidote protein VapI